MPYITQMDRILLALSDPNHRPLPLERIISEEIKEYQSSEAYRTMAAAESAYRNRTGIQEKTNRYRERTNSKIEHPLLKKLVDQKINYALSRPFSISAKNQAYSDALTEIFDNTMRRKFKSFARGAPKLGVGYMIPWIDDRGELQWMVESALRIKPLWTDTEETDVGGFIRFYDQIVYVGATKKILRRAELWSANGIQHFVAEDGGDYRPDLEATADAAVVIDGKPHNWERVPLIWVKYNEEMLPLHHYTKELIDSINWQTSTTDDVLRDVQKFVYILRNYGGEDLGQFVRELVDSMAVKVDSDGGVDKLQPEINVTAVMAFLDKQRRDAFDYGAGVDTKDPELGNASGTAINFRYMDLDNDCQGLASELQAAIERMKWFIDAYLSLSGKGDFTNEQFEIKFNMDIPANEMDVIQNVATSAGILSQRTLLANHPWVEDVDQEIEQLEQDQETALQRHETYGFPEQGGSEGGDDVDG